MAKINLHGASEQEQAIGTNSSSINVVDDLGRTITLKEPDVKAEYDLVEAIGGDLAANQVYFSMVMPLIYVTAIDGRAVFLPRRKSEVDALIILLKREGIRAVSQGVLEHFVKTQNDEDVKATVKK